MANVVLKVIKKMAIIILVVIVIAFAVLSLGFPKYMASLSESMGNYSIATMYSSLAYSYSGEIDDLARCVENAALSNNAELVVKRGEKLISHAEFEEYCIERDKEFANGQFAEYTLSYKQYMGGKLSIALAKVERYEDSVNTALNINGINGFGRGNALATLALWAVENCKGITDEIATAMDEITPLSADSEYYLSIKQILTAVK